MTLLVPRRQLRLGPLLAEGGEGRVYELADRPDQVFKEFRRPQPAETLVELVRWPTELGAAGGTRVQASSAWPLAAVIGESSGGPRAQGQDVGKGGSTMANGLLLPRAPRRFSLRHRDGRSHLASLSYLTADPVRRSAAYGVALPEPMGPDRLGLVYALARLLEAFESASPSVSHGDLSAKNVLWSLGRGPEVFVLDCDSAERWGRSGGLGPPERRRAMTPNWDDPSVPVGANPGAYADRYSLALIFLRVCGAAHFPIQKRQKAGESVELEIGVPALGRRARSLAEGAPLWELCARGLVPSEPSSRPPASAWVAALQRVIEELGATRILDAVWASQGRAPVTASVAVASMPSEFGGVTVRPVALDWRSDADVARRGAVGAMAAAGSGWTATRTAAGGVVGGTAPAGRGRGSNLHGSPVGAGTAPLASPQGPSLLVQLRHLLRAVLQWMLEEHRRTLRYLRTPNRRRRGLLRIPWCAAIDFLAGCVVLFIAAMVASPFLGV